MRVRQVQQPGTPQKQVQKDKWFLSKKTRIIVVLVVTLAIITLVVLSTLGIIASSIAAIISTIAGVLGALFGLWPLIFKSEQSKVSSIETNPSLLSQKTKEQWLDEGDSLFDINQKAHSSETVGEVAPKLQPSRQNTLDFDKSREKETILSYKPILQEIREEIAKTDLTIILINVVTIEKIIERCKIKHDPIFEELEDIKEKPFTESIRSSIAELYKKIMLSNRELIRIFAFVRELKQDGELSEEDKGVILRLMIEYWNDLRNYLKGALVIISDLESMSIHPL